LSPAKGTWRQRTWKSPRPDDFWLEKAGEQQSSVRKAETWMPSHGGWGEGGLLRRRDSARRAQQQPRLLRRTGSPLKERT